MAASSASPAPLNPLFVDPLDETLPSSCEECNLELPFYGLLERHRVDVHGEDEILVCGKCANPFKRKTNLVFHWRSTSHRFIKFVGCDICDAFNLSNGFADEENLAEHTAEVHGEGAIINPKEYGQQYKCPLCKEDFSLRKALMEHISKKHLDHLYGDMLQAKGEIKEELMKDELHFCTVCSRGFRLKSVLDKHKESHVGNKTATPAPSVSPMVSPTKTVILQQQQHASAALVAEGVSNKNSQQQEGSLPTLQQPLKPVAMQQLQPQERAPPKTIPCKYCDKAFTRELVLKMHMDMAHGGAGAVKKEPGGAEGNKSQGAKANRHPSLPGTTIYIRSQQQQSAPTQPTGMRPRGPATFLNTTANRIIASHRPSPHAPTGMNNSLQNLAPRPRLPVGLPPLALAAKRSSNGSFKGGVARGGAGIKSNGSGTSQFRIRTKNGMPGVVPGHDSSSEDDEGIPRHANVIMKRIHNDDDDADWTSRVKRVNVGADGVRTSSRIRTKKDRTTTEAAEEKRRRLDESADSNGGTGASTPKVNNGHSTKEIVPITRPYEPRPAAPDGRDRSAELVEVCVIEGCDRKFYSYQSMMRHVAFKHQAERTMFYMKLRDVVESVDNKAEVGSGATQNGSVTAANGHHGKEQEEPVAETSVKEKENNSPIVDPEKDKEKANGDVLERSNAREEKAVDDVEMEVCDGKEKKKEEETAEKAAKPEEKEKDFVENKENPVVDTTDAKPETTTESEKTVDKSDESAANAEPEPDADPVVAAIDDASQVSVAPQVAAT